MDGVEHRQWSTDSCLPCICVVAISWNNHHYPVATASQSLWEGSHHVPETTCIFVRKPCVKLSPRTNPYSPPERRSLVCTQIALVTSILNRNPVVLQAVPLHLETLRLCWACPQTRREKRGTLLPADLEQTVPLISLTVSNSCLGCWIDCPLPPLMPATSTNTWWVIRCIP